MSRSPATALYTRVSNSFSQPVTGTTIDPTDADTFFDDVEESMNSFICTSTTSLTVGAGSKAFTTQTTKAFLAGMFVQAFSQADHANYMYGTVTSYTGGVLTLDVTVTGGAGTLADWLLFTSGARGPQGDQGLTGPAGPSGAVGISGTPTVNQFAAWVDGTTVKGVSISGLVKGNGASVPAAAVAGTDYLAPAAIGVTVQAYDAQLFSNIPQNSQSAAYTLVATDAQKHILHPSADNNARTFTIPANASVAYPIGTAITFINEINTVTIAINSDTLVLAGAGTTGSRTLAANGMATAIKKTSTSWIISGTGLT